jgi:hypothetical protein
LLSVIKPYSSITDPMVRRNISPPSSRPKVEPTEVRIWKAELCTALHGGTFHKAELMNALVNALSYQRAPSTAVYKKWPPPLCGII